MVLIVEDSRNQPAELLIWAPLPVSGLRRAGRLPPQTPIAGYRHPEGHHRSHHGPRSGAQGDVCQQSSITVDLNHPDANGRAMGYVGGLYQKHPFGSDAHYDSMRRRSYAESAFSNIKSEAEQSLRRPSIRVMGRTKMTSQHSSSPSPPTSGWDGSGDTARTWPNRKPACTKGPPSPQP